MKIHELLEALKPSQYRKYVKGWDKSKYDDIFKGKYRIELEAPVDNKAKPDPYVKQALHDAGYEIVDYQEGIAKKDNDNRHTKIGKILKDPDTLKRFTNDPSRASGKSTLKIVISRHPYDIAGMSTGRGWTSCMNIDTGTNRKYVAIDIKEGTLIAYLVDIEDKDIKKPKARVLIKPFINKKSDKVSLGVSNAIYGSPPDWFGNKVVEWADSINDSKKLQGIFTLPPNLYDDDEQGTMIHGNISPEDLADQINDTKNAKSFAIISDMAKKKLITDEVLLLCTDFDVSILRRLLHFCNLKPKIQIAWCNRKDDNASEILDAMFNDFSEPPCEEAIIAAIKRDLSSLKILRLHNYVLKSNMVKPATDIILDRFYSANMNEDEMHDLINEFQRNKLKNVPAEALKQIAKNGVAAVYYAQTNHIRFEEGEKAMARDIPNTFNTFKSTLLRYMIQIFDKNKARPEILLDKLKENEACWLEYVKTTGYKD